MVAKERRHGLVWIRAVPKQKIHCLSGLHLDGYEERRSNLGPAEASCLAFAGHGGIYGHTAIQQFLKQCDIIFASGLNQESRSDLGKIRLWKR